MAQQLNISTPNIAQVVGAFDVLRVERGSISTGPFTEITAAAATRALLLGSTTSPYVVNGLVLSLVLNHGSQIDVTLVGTNPINVDDVAAQINTAVGQTIATDQGGQLQLRSNIYGSESQILIVGGTAATLLGFTATQESVGLDAFIALQSGVDTYTYVDNHGSVGQYYRTYYYNTTTQASSGYSAVFQGVTASGVSQLTTADTTVASVSLIDGSGVGIAGQRILFYPVDEVLTVAGHTAGLRKQPVEMVTDGNGDASITLVRGMRFRVVFEGTSLIRDVTTPDAAAFDLMAAVGTASDIFDYAQPQIPAAPRRTS